MSAHQDAVNKDAARARLDFEKFLRPMLEKYFHTTGIFSVEKHRTEFESSLDYCGIDAQVATRAGLIPVGCRLQYGTNYKAHSTRFWREETKQPTEYQKDTAVIEGRAARPMAAFKIHGFVTDDGRTAVVAVADTRKLYSVIRRNLNRWRKTKKGDRFYYTPWREIPGVGVYRVDSLLGDVDDVTEEFVRSV